VTFLLVLILFCFYQVCIHFTFETLHFFSSLKIEELAKVLDSARCVFASQYNLSAQFFAQFIHFVFVFTDLFQEPFRFVAQHEQRVKIGLDRIDAIVCDQRS